MEPQHTAAVEQPSRLKRLPGQLFRRNPFVGGDILPGRVPLIWPGSGRPSLPFPHPWNYDEPIRILQSFFYGADELSGSARHNRYLNAPGFAPVFVSRDPAVIRAILHATGDKPGQFDRDTMPSQGIARATGEDTLLYSNGPMWRRQKKLSASPFSRSQLYQPERFGDFETTFRETIFNRLAALRELQAARGEETTQLKLESEIKAVMLEMLVNNFFGADLSYDEIRNRYVPALELVIDHIVTDTIMNRFRFLKPLSQEVKTAQADFEALTDIALAPRLQGKGLWAQFKSEASDESLRSNIRVFLAGALEATTSFASWALAHLARQPDLQERLFHEVIDIQEYNPENLDQAKELNRVLDETLRLSPSLYFLPRRATADTTIETLDGRKLFLPNGTHILLDVWHANRCEEFWGKEVSGYPAADFAPDRFKVLEEKGLSGKDMMHFGFGHGPRVCPGKFLGQLEVGLVVGAVVRTFTFSAVNDDNPARAGVSTKPADGVLVDLRIRSHAE